MDCVKNSGSHHTMSSLITVGTFVKIIKYLDIYIEIKQLCNSVTCLMYSNATLTQFVAVKFDTI